MRLTPHVSSQGPLRQAAQRCAFRSCGSARKRGCSALRFSQATLAMELRERLACALLDCHARWRWRQPFRLMRVEPGASATPFSIGVSTPDRLTARGVEADIKAWVGGASCFCSCWVLVTTLHWESARAQVAAGRAADRRARAERPAGAGCRSPASGTTASVARQSARKGNSAASARDGAWRRAAQSRTVHCLSRGRRSAVESRAPATRFAAC